jgi:hypothetical protein
VIKAAEPILRHDQDRQIHCSSQVAHKIIRSNGHKPAANSFHNHMLNSILKCMKNGQNTRNVDLGILYDGAHNWRDRGFKPNWVNVVNCEACTASGQQKVSILTISAANRFHSGTRGA